MYPMSPTTFCKFLEAQGIDTGLNEEGYEKLVTLHIAKYSEDVQLQDMQRLTNLEFVYGVEAKDVYTVALDAIKNAHQYL